jgi:hypothetical protein
MKALHLSASHAKDYKVPPFYQFPPPTLPTSWPEKIGGYPKVPWFISKLHFLGQVALQKGFTPGPGETFGKIPVIPEHCTDKARQIFEDKTYEGKGVYRPKYTYRIIDKGYLWNSVKEVPLGRPTDQIRTEAKDIREIISEEAKKAYDKLPSFKVYTPVPDQKS